MIINIAGGTGVMGKIHKPVFENAGHKVIISGRKTSPSLEEAAQEADLTIISVPISATREIIKKLAPYCTAVMDFTTLKESPIRAMLTYSQEECEVAGLHPLYGDVSSLQGRTVVYCPTDRTGGKCREIVRSLNLAGARIKVMEPKDNDLFIVSYLQNARRKLIQAYGLLLKESGLGFEELWEISPPPTRVLLELLARQESSTNENLYNTMEDFDIWGKETEEKLAGSLKKAVENSKGISQEIRDFFGSSLSEVQERAKKLINNS